MSQLPSHPPQVLLMPRFMKHVITFILLSISAFAQTARADETYAFRPFLETYCTRCHGADEQQGELRLDTLAPNFSDPLVTSKWADVLNSINGHEMPPKDEKQPSVEAAGRFAEWLEKSLAHSEIEKRTATVVMRRINRAEYNNTIRDLVGLDFDAAEAFPEDPPAGGFDNIGAALTMSPLQMELYYSAARNILDHALVEGKQPAAMKWHFEPEDNSDGTDRFRVKHDGNNILLNDGANTTEKNFTVVHHDSWDKGIGFRDFQVPTNGEYIIRVQAAGRVPSRAAVVASARTILEHRRDEAVAKKPESKKREDDRLNEDLKHFETARIYDYGPPRVKVGINLGGTPQAVTEFDVD
ncbi:MAG: DUF1587 domain-containing protein, partial [Planctomycetota bacterium]|nr:DUF1587 domain-containing protein [Planctomycetota bacterium]